MSDPIQQPTELPFPGTRAERDAEWRAIFVVGQPHPYAAADPSAEPLTAEWVDETIRDLLDLEDRANAE